MAARRGTVVVPLVILGVVGAAFALSWAALSVPEGTVVPGIAFRTGSTAYFLGDTVAFALLNNRDTPVCLPSPAPYTILIQSIGDWLRVETHTGPATMVVVDPGETASWTWWAVTDFRNDLAPVTPGLYRIDLALWTGGQEFCMGPEAERFTINAYFRLL